MNLRFEPFDDFIKNYTIETSRSRYADSEIRQVQIHKNYIFAQVEGTRLYTEEICKKDVKNHPIAVLAVVAVFALFAGDKTNMLWEGGVLLQRINAG